MDINNAFLKRNAMFCLISAIEIDIRKNICDLINEGLEISNDFIVKLKERYEQDKKCCSDDISVLIDYLDMGDYIQILNSNNEIFLDKKILKKLILEDLDNFLKELGTGFSYIENEYKIKIGNTFNYIDLLLYNIKFNCYVVIELKVTELKKEHIGQIQIYMNYVDKNIKTINQDKTIGVIICKKDNGYYIEYSSDNRIFSKNYILS